MKPLIFAVMLLIGSGALASGLMINATEFGVGKFHRYDNKQHPYAANNVWAAHIMPDNPPTGTPIVFDNSDQSVTIQFTNLEELLRTAVSIAQQRHTQIGVLNINGHGMPGGMWYPMDATTRDGAECGDWRAAASEPDVKNYQEYYSPVSRTEILELHASAYMSGHYACTTGADEWKTVVARIPNIQDYFTDDAQIHFESCIVGYGPAGEKFALTVASLLLKGSHAMVKTSMDFGLGDWSMPEGMGFWDYQNETQLSHDNKIYPVDREDREIMQKGTIRVVSQVNGQWQSSLVGNQQFMLVGFDQHGFSDSPAPVLYNYHSQEIPGVAAPAAIRIPGTGKYAQRVR